MQAKLEKKINYFVVVFDPFNNYYIFKYYINSINILS